MKYYTYIFLCTLCLMRAIANAQTPFDSFAPETSRPMLGLDAITSRENPFFCGGINDSVLNTEPSADDISKWLSVDPLADKYPNISPYAYCGWNPVRYVDPNGEYYNDENEQIAQKIQKVALEKAHDAQGNNERMRELASTTIDIIDMRYDPDHEYRFESDSENPRTSCQKDATDEHQIISMYSYLEMLDETVAHEVRHGGQTARGETFYDNNNYIQNYDAEKEVDAYRAQWGWRGSALQIPIDNGKYPFPVPANANYFDITIDLINSITNGPLDINNKLYHF